MSLVRRVRAGGRRAAIAAFVLALVFAGTIVFFAVAGASSKPPKPSLSANVTDPTAATSVQFTFSDSWHGVSFRCSLDHGAYTTCASPKTYGPLSQGNHSFSVVAVKGKHTSKAATFAWAIVPPSPTILTHPDDPTNSTTAQFTFTHAQPGVQFKCSLDRSHYSSCSSPKTYTNLRGGRHTFAVEAIVHAKPSSIPATFSWTIDQTAPAITLTFPADGRTYNAAGWSAGCPTAGICGTAADIAGVTDVAVAMRQQSNGKYWNGSRVLLALDRVHHRDRHHCLELPARSSCRRELHALRARRPTGSATPPRRPSTRPRRSRSTPRRRPHPR